MKKKLSLLVMIAMLICLVAPVTTAQAAGKISKTKASIVTGETLKLKVTGTKSKVTWSTSDKAVATVKDGKVTAKKKGTATITAKAGKETFKCKVTVKNATLKVSSSKSELTERTFQSVINVETNAQKFSAKIDDEKVARVFYYNDEAGKYMVIWPLNPGKATITVKAGNAKKKISVSVEKNDNPDLPLGRDDFNWTKEYADANDGFTNFVDWSISEYKNNGETYYITIQEDADSMKDYNHGLTVGSTWKEITEQEDSWDGLYEVSDTTEGIYTLRYLDEETGLQFYKIYEFEGFAGDYDADDTKVARIIWYCYHPESY